jgi:hypothetical protein
VRRWSAIDSMKALINDFRSIIGYSSSRYRTLLRKAR